MMACAPGAVKHKSPAPLSRTALALIMIWSIPAVAFGGSLPKRSVRADHVDQRSQHYRPDAADSIERG
jgi:hypothetical protein